MWRPPQLKNEPMALESPGRGRVTTNRSNRRRVQHRPLGASDCRGIVQAGSLSLPCRGNMTWVENAFPLDPNADQQTSADALRHLVARHLLKECGDARGAASILETLTQEPRYPRGCRTEILQAAVPLHCRSTRRTRANRHQRPGRRRSGRIQANAISLVLWGNDYIERFEEYCARSLAANGNIPALKARGPVTLLIHTAARDVEKIRNLESLRRLASRSASGRSRTNCLRPQQATSNIGCWAPSRASISFTLRARGANFLPIFPDAIYSARYFDIPVRPGAPR